ncbi:MULTISPECIES: Flp pilus assembly protein CpaB [Neomoorella]|uniref:SAF domain protein n=1 Tax=Moorella mulderi DSM 14980 TaxID=1122241 RepID=A0A151AVG6_9FIRM|nr:Flp pilus assembly protein CpaB [Moorella mulderi]KYH31553.1 SAF domain protein [Moorella mulderi DSM 14980]
MRLFKNYRLLLALAAVCAVIAALAATTTLNSYLSLTPVVVAGRDIKPNELISERDLAIKEFPARIVGNNWLRSPAGVAGKASQGFIPAGMPLTASMLADPLATGLAGKLKAYPGTVALSIEAKNDTTVGSSIKPGDLVNVYALIKNNGSPANKAGVELLATKVPVLATPGGDTTSANPNAKGVVLAVTPEQASQILDALASGSSLACTLEKAGD